MEKTSAATAATPTPTTVSPSSVPTSARSLSAPVRWSANQPGDVVVPRPTALRSGWVISQPNPTTDAEHQRPRLPTMTRAARPAPGGVRRVAPGVVAAALSGAGSAMRGSCPAGRASRLLPGQGSADCTSRARAEAAQMSSTPVRKACRGSRVRASEPSLRADPDQRREQQPEVPGRRRQRAGEREPGQAHAHAEEEEHRQGGSAPPPGRGAGRAARWAARRWRWRCR